MCSQLTNSNPVEDLHILHITRCRHQQTNAESLGADPNIGALRLEEVETGLLRNDLQSLINILQTRCYNANTYTCCCNLMAARLVAQDISL